MGCSLAGPHLFGRGPDARGVDGHDRRAVHVRDQGRGRDSGRLRLERRPARIGDSLLSIGAVEISERSYADYIRALRSLSDQIGKTIEVQWRDQHTRESQDAPGCWFRHPPSWTYYRSWSGFSRSADLRHRGPGLLEAARRRLGAVVLRALHRHGRRLHGGLSLDRDRRRAGLDLPVRACSRCSCRWSTSISSWSSRGRIPFWCGIDGGCSGALRDLDGLSGRCSGGACWRRAGWRLHEGGSRDDGGLSGGPLAGAGVHRPGGGPLRDLHLLPGVQLPQRADPRRAEPGSVDPAGLADRLGPDRLPADPGLDRPGDAWGGATPPGRCSASRCCTRWPMPSASRATS